MEIYLGEMIIERAFSLNLVAGELFANAEGDISRDNGGKGRMCSRKIDEHRD